MHEDQISYKEAEKKVRNEATTYAEVLKNNTNTQTGTDQTNKKSLNERMKQKRMENATMEVEMEQKENESEKKTLNQNLPKHEDIAMEL